jgi:hypothetical protein
MAITNSYGRLAKNEEKTNDRKIYNAAIDSANADHKVLGVCRRILGEEHSDTLTAMGNPAGTLRGQGDLAGADTLKKSKYESLREFSRFKNSIDLPWQSIGSQKVVQKLY